MRSTLVFISLLVFALSSCKKDKLQGIGCETSCKVIAVQDSTQGYSNEYANLVYNYDNSSDKLVSYFFDYYYQGISGQQNNTLLYLANDHIILNQGKQNEEEIYLNSFGLPVSRVGDGYSYNYTYSSPYRLKEIIYTTDKYSRGTVTATLGNIIYNSGDLVSFELSVADTVYFRASFEYDQSKCHISFSPLDKLSGGLALGYDNINALNNFQAQTFSDHLMTRSSLTTSYSQEISGYTYQLDGSGKVTKIVASRYDNTGNPEQGYEHTTRFTYDCP